MSLRAKEITEWKELYDTPLLIFFVNSDNKIVAAIDKIK
jgi:hypothetical protein